MSRMHLVKDASCQVPRVKCLLSKLLSGCGPGRVWASGVWASGCLGDPCRAVEEHFRARASLTTAGGPMGNSRVLAEFLKEPCGFVSGIQVKTSVCDDLLRRPDTTSCEDAERQTQNGRRRTAYGQECRWLLKKTLAIRCMSEYCDCTRTCWCALKRTHNRSSRQARIDQASRDSLPGFKSSSIGSWRGEKPRKDVNARQARPSQGGISAGGPRQGPNHAHARPRFRQAPSGFCAASPGMGLPTGGLHCRRAGREIGTGHAPALPVGQGLQAHKNSFPSASPFHNNPMSPVTHVTRHPCHACHHKPCPRCSSCTNPPCRSFSRPPSFRST